MRGGYSSGAGLWPLLFAIAAPPGCTPAPLEGKACDQAADPAAGGLCAAGYVCCRSIDRCLKPGESCPCSAIRMDDPIITTSGHPLVGEADPTEIARQLRFDAPSGQWVSYAFLSDERTPVTDNVISDVTPDGSGFHVHASFVSATSTPLLFEGFGLTYRVPDICIDGGGYTGVQFDFSGDLGGRTLITSVTSADDVSITKDARRGTCTYDFRLCYGPTHPSPETATPITDAIPIAVTFDSLVGGMPHMGLDASRIVNVQWQLNAATNPVADFTIRNLKFY